jgi:predicted N-formylglutamate amidohydrolase
MQHPHKVVSATQERLTNASLHSCTPCMHGSARIHAVLVLVDAHRSKPAVHANANTGTRW